ncbi:hypothetical protein K435DRAFT_825840 [Dendrothele bispora CBS 962.96]|uniref:Phosphoinositide phospholipase C n=1 Tax=Dendrothele bispora (strain CBS 962.96) TaxID=1314807 RepID=A0A4S8MVM9_DENBC|nr:hypothetical protein K435DRAFT_825840 [Dendrothele bispora CBS 962.96]
MPSNVTEIEKVTELHAEVRPGMTQKAQEVLRPTGSTKTGPIDTGPTNFWKLKSRRFSEQLSSPPKPNIELKKDLDASSSNPAGRSSKRSSVAPRRALKRARNLLTTSGKPVEDVRDLVPGLEAEDKDQHDKPGLFRRQSTNLRRSIKRKLQGASRSFRTKSAPEPEVVEDQKASVERRRSFVSPPSSLQTRTGHGRSYSEVVGRRQPLTEISPTLSSLPASPVDVVEPETLAGETSTYHSNSAVAPLPIPLSPSNSVAADTQPLSNTAISVPTIAVSLEPITQSVPYTDVAVPEVLQRGTPLTKISSKKPSKHTQFVFRIDSGRGMVIWETPGKDEKDHPFLVDESSASKKTKTKFIPVENIREIRTDYMALIHLTQYGFTPSEYMNRWMTLIYVVSASAARNYAVPLLPVNATSKYTYSGQSYKVLHLLAPSAEIKSMWEQTLKDMVGVWAGLSGFGGGLNRNREMEEMRKGLWERTYWDGVREETHGHRNAGGDSCVGKDDCMTFERVEKLCKRLNVRMSTQEVHRLFDQTDTQHRGYLSFEDFQQFVKLLKARPELNRLYKSVLRDYARQEGINSQISFTFDVFEHFMREKQKSALPTSDLQAIFDKYSQEKLDLGEEEASPSTPPTHSRPLPRPLQPSTLLTPSLSTLPTPPPSMFSTPVTVPIELDSEDPSPYNNTLPTGFSVSSIQHSAQQVMSLESFMLFLLSSDNPTLLEPVSDNSQGFGSAAGEPSHHLPLLRHLVLDHFLGHSHERKQLGTEPTRGSGANTPSNTGSSSPLTTSMSKIDQPQSFSEISHDMTRPLSDYFISSSHNTYLLGHQLVGISTTEGYVRALLSGCRSVELDIFDTDTGPQIFHGKTLTSKVPLREVCEVIMAYGFIASQYPIIISAEVHCGYVGQGMIANIMKEVFGSRLVRKEKGIVVGMEKEGSSSSQSTVDEASPESHLEGGQEEELVASLLKDWQVEELPSPEALKGRIMLKTKNLYLAARRDSKDLQLVVSPFPPGEAPSIGALGQDTTSSTSDTDVLGRRPSQRDNDSMVNDIKQEFRRARNMMQRVRSHKYSTKSPPRAYSPPETPIKGRPRSPSSPDQRIKVKMNPALLPLLVYTIGVKYRGINKKEEYAANEMFSLSENTANKLLKDGLIDLIKHSKGHLVRIYPRGTRVSSTNYEPHRYWSGGAQLVAINWQTFDTGHMINQSMFQRNGRSGYVLKPLPLRDPHKDTFSRRKDRFLDVTIISAQQLPSRRDEDGREIAGKSDADPYVEVTLHVPDWANPPPTSLWPPPNSIASGLRKTNSAAYALATPDEASTSSPNPPVSSLPAQKISYRTGVVKNNRFNPIWEEKLRLPFTCVEGMEELVFVTFSIKQEDKEDEDPLAMFCASLGCLQHGYRHLPLHDAQMAQYLFSTLFVRIDIS